MTDLDQNSLFPYREIVQSIIDRMSTALLNDDAVQFASCFSMPVVIQTFDDQRVISGLEELRRMFDDIRLVLTNFAVTTIVQRCSDAALIGSTRISACGEGHILSDAQVILPPFPILLGLHAVDGIWRVDTGQFAIIRGKWLTAALMGTVSLDREPPVAP
ncbi:hypothetical protein SAMN04488003_101257 [Loktanella fryxellensis]|uniref:SnoaL-like domain-containing protein n=1 Tax=Loktanella fryxellensis TaxID=245187 RepID=A0A1H7YS65_9RHOB|nr:hypothetical protein [Loktanella fryxellensis]SEM48039.1 hypothetical protein SAMN04488003_101257 [Loktanella fryxellensis]